MCLKLHLPCDRVSLFDVCICYELLGFINVFLFLGSYLQFV